MYISIQNINENNLKEFYGKIRKSKQNKISKLYHSKDKLLSILGEYLLYEIITQKLNIDYSKCKFKNNKNGKPNIINYNIYFNISHSHDYTVCIVSNNKCGIDIEKIRKIKINIIKEYATENEIKYIMQSKKDTYKRAFEIFVLKEAYIKMKGSTIQNIKNVEFSVYKNTIKCSDKNIKAKLNYQINDYIIATCEQIKS